MIKIYYCIIGYMWSWNFLSISISHRLQLIIHNVAIFSVINVLLQPCNLNMNGRAECLPLIIYDITAEKCLRLTRMWKEQSVRKKSKSDKWEKNLRRLNLLNDLVIQNEVNRESNSLTQILSTIFKIYRSFPVR